MNRRRFLALSGVGVVGAVAGCSSEADSVESVDSHPAAADLDAQPRRGELGGHVILAFEDPSCPTCRRFHENTLPDIRENIVDAGKGAYVVRTYPVIYPWGEPATQALESTFARDSEAYWSLFDHYFAEQSSFDPDNVLARTATFLTEETEVDGEAVASDARNRAHDDAVQADIQAAEDAGLGETTPIILLFEDGEFVTKVNGSVSYELIAEALGEHDG
ncbi:DSBA oxidoreductase [Haloarcula hispanica N601]|uniref:DSBA oxidoreductase n=3 Tax=Haloarcula hispanica TaxID=51589 RepID=V5TQ69_HALHI|nr:MULTISPECIES: thioredoxin domain-containing protein [Haloarcula]AEM57992.1 DSBA-like thioredoxin domain-containing protein [Haloarcula hispanica ATCC 33960]AHB66739.1 DSBA oxidoreductase [Haloarcula hispanica N601]AJF25039.1 DSBA oxidoreductase [Haloarcula sp. CBA1115]KZX47474.1 disulfide bond formation protein DsbA [Haloarcula sp. K1]MCJ0619715.1 thioredoxin domain-containing protein [Haloarcula hispanica]